MFTFSFLFHLCILEHGNEEPEELMELAQAEATNSELTEGKP
jgi:hypothetical protein